MQALLSRDSVALLTLNSLICVPFVFLLTYILLFLFTVVSSLLLDVLVGIQALNVYRNCNQLYRAPGCNASADAVPSSAAA